MRNGSFQIVSVRLMASTFALKHHQILDQSIFVVKILQYSFDANHKYRFLWVDIGQFGSISDGGVWSETELGRCVGQRSFNIPCELPGTNIKINHVLVADEAFPLGMNLLKPYSQKFLANDGEDADKARVFNYCLSRARRIIENAFGILANR